LGNLNTFQNSLEGFKISGNLMRRTVRGGGARKRKVVLLLRGVLTNDIQKKAA